MIILTGGAGMIGSMIAWHLNTILNDKKIIIVDELNHPRKEKNIAKRNFLEFVEKEKMFAFIKKIFKKFGKYFNNNTRIIKKFS